MGMGRSAPASELVLQRQRNGLRAGGGAADREAGRGAAGARNARHPGDLPDRGIAGVRGRRPRLAVAGADVPAQVRALRSSRSRCRWVTVVTVAVPNATHMLAVEHDSFRKLTRPPFVGGDVTARSADSSNGSRMANDRETECDREPDGTRP